MFRRPKQNEIRRSFNVLLVTRFITSSCLVSLRSTTHPGSPRFPFPSTFFPRSPPSFTISLCRIDVHCCSFPLTRFSAPFSHTDMREMRTALPFLFSILVFPPIFFLIVRLSNFSFPSLFSYYFSYFSYLSHNSLQFDRGQKTFGKLL